MAGAVCGDGFDQFFIFKKYTCLVIASITGGQFAGKDGLVYVFRVKV